MSRCQCSVYIKNLFDQEESYLGEFLIEDIQQLLESFEDKEKIIDINLEIIIES